MSRDSHQRRLSDRTTDAHHNRSCASQGHIWLLNSPVAMRRHRLARCLRAAIGQYATPIQARHPDARPLPPEASARNRRYCFPRLRPLAHANSCRSMSGPFGHCAGGPNLSRPSTRTCHNWRFSYLAVKRDVRLPHSGMIAVPPAPKFRWRHQKRCFGSYDTTLARTAAAR